jgi:hypothetical protein
MRVVGFSEVEAREAVRAARSYSEALRKLGYRVAGGNHATLKKYAQLWGISTDHFDTSWANRIPDVEPVSRCPPSWPSDQPTHEPI